MSEELSNQLSVIIAQGDWDQFLRVIKPKTFHQDEYGNKITREAIAKIAYLLTRPGINLPYSVIIVILKSLTNSCIPLTGYRNKSIDTSLIADLHQNYCNRLYESLSGFDTSLMNDELWINILQNYPETCFPYDGIVRWIVDYLSQFGQYQSCESEQLQILRNCFTFLCNIIHGKDSDRPADIYNQKVKDVVIKLLMVDMDESDLSRLLHAVCCFIGNILDLSIDYFNHEELPFVAQGLLKVAALEIDVANDILMILLKKPYFLHIVYNTLSSNHKLYLMEMIHQKIRRSIYQMTSLENGPLLSDDAIEFLIDRFNQRSDIILNTADTFPNDMEPVEITVIVDILGLLTSNRESHCSISKNERSFLINVVYLLKALHQLGKKYNNYFTPVQTLSECAPSTQGQGDGPKIQNHPAFGFKAALIRVIGNLVYRNKENQNLVQELDGIPLLLDCCNMDARNPLIIQWTTMAIRNMCEGNFNIQKIIEQSRKVENIDAEIAQQMGMTLNINGDGSTIGIMPLPRSV